MQRRWIPVAVTGLMMVGSAAAGAAESREVREREARKACFTGNVDRGVEILVDLYGETGHPNYIYNQARCFERNGKYDQALLSYEDYLRKAKDLGEAERAQVEKSIAELRAKVGVGAATAGAGAPAAGAPALLSPGARCVGHGARRAAGDEAASDPSGSGGQGGARVDWPWQRKAGVVSLVVAGGGAWRWASPGPCCARAGRGDFNDVCTVLRRASRCRAFVVDGAPIAAASTTAVKAARTDDVDRVRRRGRVRGAPA